MHAQQADHWMRMYVVGGVHNAQKKKLKDKNSDQLKTLFVNQLIYLICIEKLHLISFLQNVHECWMEKDSIHLVKCIWAFKNPLKIRNCIQKIIITTAHLITIFDTSLSKFAFYINLINQLCSFFARHYLSFHLVAGKYKIYINGGFFVIQKRHFRYY